MAARKLKETPKSEWADLSGINGDFVRSMKACRPRKEGVPTFDITMSDEDILGDVKYVLLTGNEPYDRIVGGFAFGRINEVFGLENCGKTAMMVRSMCRFQAKHVYEVIDRQGFVYTVQRVPPDKIVTLQCYVDNEHSLEKGFKITIWDVTTDDKGVEKREMVEMSTPLMVADTIDHIFQAIDKFIERIKVAEAAIEEDGSGRVVLGVFICDTVAGTSSKEELERAWGDRDYPRGAQQISEGFRCVTNDIARHNVAAIFTNQVRTKFKDLQKGTGYRAKFNTPQEEDFSTYGGKALAFYSTHRVFMFQVPVRYTLVKGAQFSAGYLIGFRTHKNRLRKPGREGRMVLLFDEEQGGLHNVFSILESMIFLRVAERSKDGGAITFKFRKNKIATTTFADNITLEDTDETGGKRRKRVPDPKIDDRYEWPAFYKAHRNDFDLLWEAAMRHAYETDGLSGYYEPDPDEEEVEDSDPDPAPPRTGRFRNRPVAALEDPDIT
jgi:RecA/RadA recombinase